MPAIESGILAVRTSFPVFGSGFQKQISICKPILAWHVLNISSGTTH